ncbi:LysR family transcriptional regulator [Henriciella pelagia]|jgi:DNA-binding transcriptional LysR family regulator|uniref:LysR family transcriptional regulator n=2 Tax=Henriciella pelagia TaxID=1977912 RepID=A0ABQ1J1M9_9PROT|nr:LysR family transcriptional regulator [Henriciella pelagia]GGB56490.1 LysR family transcriptional regulator [Henriciella pelagia]
MAMLNATWLETFAVLCETGHFTRTAQRLGMTQPGVSQHVRKLEEQVGHPLISKQGKHFWPTPVGESVFALGLARRAEEERFRKSIEVDDPDSGEVKIACSGGFAMSLYPHLLPVMQAAPNLAIHVEAAPQKSIRAGILEGRFDLGVLASDPDHPRLTARLIGREELCVVLPIDAASARLDFEALDARGFIAHPDGFAYADALFSLNFPDEFEGADRLHVRAYVNQIGQIPTPVENGIGYTLLTQSGINAFPRKHRLCTRQLGQRIHHDLWLVERRNVVRSARVDRLAGLIEQAATALGDNFASQKKRPLSGPDE